MFVYPWKPLVLYIVMYHRVTGIQGKREWEWERKTGTGVFKIIRFYTSEVHRTV